MTRLRYAAVSEIGPVRKNNQDSGYAGPHLLVVADGMGGHAGGDVASSIAIAALAPLDGESHGPAFPASWVLERTSPTSERAAERRAMFTAGYLCSSTTD